MLFPFSFFLVPLHWLSSPSNHRTTTDRPTTHLEQPEGAAACGMCLEVTKVDNMPFLSDDLTKYVRSNAVTHSNAV